MDTDTDGRTRQNAKSEASQESIKRKAEIQLIDLRSIQVTPTNNPFEIIRSSQRARCVRPIRVSASIGDDDASIDPTVAVVADRIVAAAAVD